MEAAVAGLIVYPVKSCRGISMQQARLGERGLERDREWMVVDTGGRFLSQRELPRLALITPALSDSGLELAAPGTATVAVSLAVRGPTRSVCVWRDTVSATDEGDQAAAWLSEWLGRAVRLVRFDPGARRLCNPAYAGTSGAHTAFADAYPLLVTSDASLADLNSRLAIALPMNRFRPNLVLSGIEAYDEDHIDEIRVSRSVLRLVKPCTRCRTTTTDQATAEVGIEPLPTLALYRRNDALDGVTFGMNAIVAAGADEIISVGDRAHCVLRFAD
jgi:uncharacterized protein YcbX